MASCAIPDLSKGLKRGEESVYAATCGLFGGGANVGTGPPSAVII